MNYVYILLRLDTSPNLLNNDVNIDRYEAKAFLSKEGAQAMMKAEYIALSHEADRDSYCGGDEALVVTDEGFVTQWKIQLVEVAP